MMNHDSFIFTHIATAALNHQAPIIPLLLPDVFIYQTPDAIIWTTILDYTETAKQGVNNKSMFVRRFPVSVQTVTLDLRSACRNRCVTNRWTKFARMSRFVDTSGSWRQTGLSVLRRFNWGNQSLHSWFSEAHRQRVLKHCPNQEIKEIHSSCAAFTCCIPSYCTLMSRNRKV